MGPDTSRAFDDVCRTAGVRQSTSAVGSSVDNASTEPFNETFKRETLQGRKHWSSEREARLDAFRWVTESGESLSPRVARQVPQSAIDKAYRYFGMEAP